MNGIVKALLWLIAIPVGWVWKALVAVSLWTWFIVPLGVPAVGMPHALGLTMTGWYFCSGCRVNADSDTSLTQWSAVQLAIGIVWLFGWIFQSFMT